MDEMEKELEELLNLIKQKVSIKRRGKLSKKKNGHWKSIDAIISKHVTIEKKAEKATPEKNDDEDDTIDFENYLAFESQPVVKEIKVKEIFEKPRRFEGKG